MPSDERGRMWSRVSVATMRNVIPITAMLSIALATTAYAQPGPPMRRPAPAWDSRGWVMLGERAVNGRFDHDRIEVGRIEGKFSKMAIVVEDSDLELIDLSVKFKRGPAWHPAVSHFFREGERSHAIDFPGDERTIRYIDFKY